MSGIHGSGTRDQTATGARPQEADDSDQTRSVYGPRAIGALIAPVLRPTWRKRAPATAQIIADWQSIVGPAIARDTTPRRLSAGTLIIACNGPVAMELQHLSDVLIARVNTHVGHRVVQRLRFQQDSIDSDRPLPAPPKPPSAKALQAIDNAVADLPEGPLRQALAALGRSVVTGR
jgi:hypothetical protein